VTASAAPSWKPTLGPSGLTSVLTKLRHWTGYDGDAVLDDVGMVLDDVVPRVEDVEDHAACLRKHLHRLVHVAVATGTCQGVAEAHLLIQHAQEVCALDLPGGYLPAVGHLRRLAWAVNELHDLLVALHALKGPDSLKEEGTP
jgi:hypothetical protein